MSADELLALVDKKNKKEIKAIETLQEILPVICKCNEKEIYPKDDSKELEKPDPKENKQKDTSVTYESLLKIATTFLEIGSIEEKKEKLKTILGNYNATKVSEIKETDYHGCYDDISKAIFMAEKEK